MNSVLAEVGPPILVIISGLLVLGVWKSVNHVTRREMKAQNTDPIF